MYVTKRKRNASKEFMFITPNLRTYFDRLRDGNPDDIRTPLGDGISREEILNQWDKIYCQCRRALMYEGLDNFELDMRSKVGPMSVLRPLAQRMPSVIEYFTPPELQVPISEAAIQQTCKYFSPIKGLRLRSPTRVIDDMDLSRYSGTPFCTRKSRVTNQTLSAGHTLQYVGLTDTNFETLADYVVDAISYNFKHACMLGSRTQEGGPSEDDTKNRVIWMSPYIVALDELRFYQPFILGAQSSGLIPAYVSLKEVSCCVTSIFSTKGVDDVVICTDFSSFDQSFWTPLQDAAHAIITDLLTPSEESARWLDSTFYFKYYCPLIIQLDEILYGHHGMASGSGGTNADESLAHKALQYEAALANNVNLNEYSMAYGDDGILTFPGITVEKVTSSYTKHGVQMNESKQMVSATDAIVLRRWYSTAYTLDGGMLGVYSTFRALGKLMSQERFYDPEKGSNEMVILRALSIIENCSEHPYFEQFVDFVYKGDKFGLGTKLPEFGNSIDSKFQEFKDVTHGENYTIENMMGGMSGRQYVPLAKENSDTLGKYKGDRDISGIRGWHVYQYLNSKYVLGIQK